MAIFTMSNVSIWFDYRILSILYFSFLFKSVLRSIRSHRPIVSCLKFSPTPLFYNNIIVFFVFNFFNFSYPFCIFKLLEYFILSPWWPIFVPLCHLCWQLVVTSCVLAVFISILVACCAAHQVITNIMAAPAILWKMAAMLLVLLGWTTRKWPLIENNAQTI